MGSLSDIPESIERERGVALGRESALAILAALANDGSIDTASYLPSGEMDKWRPTRLGFLPGLDPHWGEVTPFAFTHPDDLYGAPQQLDSERYAEELNEVKALGEVIFHDRTEDQTVTAYYWATPAGSLIPLRLCNPLSEYETIRLTCMMAWREKYKEDFWRPITAIALAAEDGNPACGA